MAATSRPAVRVPKMRQAMKFVYLLPVILGLAVLPACNSTSTAPTTTVAFSQTDLRLGTGTQAAANNNLTVNYTGWLYDPSKPDFKGLQFDTNTGLGPFTFTLGTGSVIAGWDQGLVGMKVGGLRQLIIPPSLAYGATRYGSIPPNSVLVFEIELTDVQ